MTDAERAERWFAVNRSMQSLCDKRQELEREFAAVRSEAAGQALTMAATIAREGLIRKPFDVLTHEEEKRHLRTAIGAAIEALRDRVEAARADAVRLAMHRMTLSASGRLEKRASPHGAERRRKEVRYEFG